VEVRQGGMVYRWKGIGRYNYPKLHLPSREGEVEHCRGDADFDLVSCRVFRVLDSQSVLPPPRRQVKEAISQVSRLYNNAIHEYRA